MRAAPSRQECRRSHAELERELERGHSCPPPRRSRKPKPTRMSALPVRAGKARRNAERSADILVRLLAARAAQADRNVGAPRPAQRKVGFPMT